MYILLIYSLASSWIAHFLITSQLQKREICRKPLTSIVTYGVTFLTYLFTFYKQGDLSLHFLIVTLILLGLIILSLIDYATYELPNILVLSVGILGIIYQLEAGSFSLSGLIFGFLAASLPLLLLALLSGGNMGGGDIKLAAACGLWLGAPMVLLGLFLSTLVASVWYIVLLLSGHKKLKTTVAFGPFLAIGFGLAYFYGRDILQWYFNLLYAM